MADCGVWSSKDWVQNSHTSPQNWSQPVRLPGAPGGWVSSALAGSVVTTMALLGADQFGP